MERGLGRRRERCARGPLEKRGLKIKISIQA